LALCALLITASVPNPQPEEHVDGLMPLHGVLNPTPADVTADTLLLSRPTTRVTPLPSAAVPA
jgi:hypothetical protein